MITITGPYHTSSGALVNGFVRIRPYPYSEDKGTGKVIGTTLVDGREKVVEFENGAPKASFDLYQGTYEVLAPLTKTQRIVVPDGTATKSLAELVNAGIANPPDWAATAFEAHLADTDNPHGVTAAQIGAAVPAIQVTALPESPTRGQVYELTQADATKLAPPGFYIQDGTGWFCLCCSAVYDLGNLSVFVSKVLIAGADYKATVTGNITSNGLSLSRVGRVGLLLSNASGYTVSQPSVFGRTSKLLSATAWDDAAEALTQIILQDDGTYLIASASALA